MANHPPKPKNLLQMIFVGYGTEILTAAKVVLLRVLSKMARKKCSHVHVHEDRLSSLTEPVLHHILSFLDMKYVIPTTLLSRRWQNFWYSLPSLSFNKRVFRSCLLDASDNYRYRKFASFISRVLLIRGSCPVQSFDLVWRRYDYDDDHDDDDASSKSDYIDQWFCAAVLRDVKELSAVLENSSDLFELPVCLFTFKSLSSLTLCLFDQSSGEKEPMKVKLADKINLPSLKTLHLELLDLSEYDNLFDILFLGCPALETLFLMGCEFTVSEVLTISFEHLKHLHIDMKCEKQVFVIRASNLLKYLWRSCSWCAFSLDGLSSLETANIDPGECYNIQNCQDSKDLKMSVAGADNGMMECLKELYNVKHLTLTSDCLQLISELPSELEKWSAPFSNLRYLNLETWLTRGCFKVIMFLLENSPNMETLVLHMDPINSEKNVEYGVESSFNLKLHHLKVAKILKFSGCKNELQHLKILLGNAVALEKMTIVKDSDRVNNVKKWNDIADKVLKLPRASSDVTINFQAA